MKVLAKNARATYDYQIEDKLVAGLALLGWEVKSARAGHVSLRGSYVTLAGGEAFLTGAHITPYQPAGHPPAGGQAEPARSRKLLLHRREIEQLVNRKQSGLQAVPLALLLDHNLIKLEIGLGKGKKRYDKRETIKKRDTERDTRRQSRRV